MSVPRNTSTKICERVQPREYTVTIGPGPAIVMSVRTGRDFVTRHPVLLVRRRR